MIKQAIFILAALFSAAMASAADAPALAGNSIQEVQTQLTGDRMLVKVMFRDPLKATPSNWSTSDPARVVFDFPDTDNRTGGGSQAINAGSLKSYNLVQVDRLTRLVLNLRNAVGYSASSDGRTFMIALEAFRDQSAPTSPAATVPAARDAGRATPLAAVRDINFRRGEQGQALITVDLSDGTIPIDVRKSGSGGLVIDFQNAELPDALRNRRDVNDFATPVTLITPSSGSDHVKLDIAVKGKWTYQSQLSNNQLQLEVKLLSADEANRIVPTGQEAKKISFNIYDADLAVVLRELGEMSGRSVYIDPALLGRRFSLSLDNVPFDMALELVMSQQNVGMRIKNDIIVFGPRDVLTKRDQDAADEMARANDTAPLVAESFQLSFIPVADMLSLIQANTAAPTATAASAAGAAPGGAAPGAAAAAAATTPCRGMLSSRCVISTHANTNKLFLKDTAAVVDAVRQLIREVDIPAKQVLIEARIVEVSTDFTRDLGSRLNFYDRKPVTTGGMNHSAFGTVSSVASPTGFSNVDIFGAPATPSLTAASTRGAGTSFASFNNIVSSSLNLMLFNSAATKLLTLELRAAETDQKSRTVSMPRLVTQNRKQAKVENVHTVNLVVGVNAQTGLPIYQAFPVRLSLGVTPSITPDNRVSLELVIDKGTLTLSASSPPVTDTNNLTTTVMVENGGTVAIGGFYREAEGESQDRVPVLGDLPYVGFLFKMTNKTRNKSELMVLVTPRIIGEELALR